ncbi:MAG: methyltransferase domain-containing protein [Candidatus Thorarchaeota archaeon]
MFYWTISSLKLKAKMWDPFFIQYKLLPLLKPKKNENYLDCGCGFSPLGNALINFILPNGTIFGIDNNIEYINEAKKDVKEKKMSERLLFKFGEATNLEFEDQSFDASFCQQLLVNTNHPEKILKEMIRVTKKDNGRIMAVENSNLGAFIHHPKFNVIENQKLTNIYQKIILLGKSAYDSGDTSLGSKLSILFQNLGLYDVYSEYIFPHVPEQNYHLLNSSDINFKNEYINQQFHLQKIFELWANKIIPDYLSEEDWKFFLEKVFLEKYNEKALNDKREMIQFVHPLTLSIGWLKKQFHEEFISFKSKRKMK